MGSVTRVGETGLRYGVGQLAPGTGYALSFVLSAEGVQCARPGGLSRDNAEMFDVQAGKISELRVTLPCSGVPGLSASIRVSVLGSGGHCQALTAEPAMLPVGDSAILQWDRSEPSAERTWSVSPMSTVGQLRVGAEGVQFRCAAAGVATITLQTTRGPCTASPQTVQITCEPLPGQDCCPIDPLFSDPGVDPAADCLRLGGSPPCFTGCACLRAGGGGRTVTDAHGCLEWELRKDPSQPWLALCLDADGNPNPDPRKSCGSYAPLAPGKPTSSCSPTDLLSVLDPTETICASSADRSCDASGSWHVTFASSASTLKCAGRPLPPQMELDLTVPGSVKVSENGCELSLVYTQGWSNSSECGTYGYSLFLQIDGDSASGRLHTAEGGFCQSDARVQAQAQRVR